MSIVFSDDFALDGDAPECAAWRPVPAVESNLVVQRRGEVALFDVTFDPAGLAPAPPNGEETPH